MFNPYLYLLVLLEALPVKLLIDSQQELDLHIQYFELLLYHPTTDYIDFEEIKYALKDSKDNKKEDANENKS